MDKAEYTQKMFMIEAQYKESKNKLYHEYVESTRKFKVGDIIRDNNTNTIIAVEKITGYFSLNRDFPEPVYHGKLLTKKLLPTKRGEVGTIWGDTNVEHLGYDN